MGYRRTRTIQDHHYCLLPWCYGNPPRIRCHRRAKLQQCVSFVVAPASLQSTLSRSLSWEGPCWMNGLATAVTDAHLFVLPSQTSELGTPTLSSTHPRESTRSSLETSAIGVTRRCVGVCTRCRVEEPSGGHWRRFAGLCQLTLLLSFLTVQVITEQQGQELAEELGLRYLETSAKTNINVEEAFFALARFVSLLSSHTPFRC